MIGILKSTPKPATKDKSVNTLTKKDLLKLYNRDAVAVVRNKQVKVLEIDHSRDSYWEDDYSVMN